MRPAYLLGIWALLGGTTLNAQQSDPPMNMTPEEMRQMHAPNPVLDHPANTQSVTPPAMAGMATDMDDAALAHRVWIENLEGIAGTQHGDAWDAQGWIGGDFDKLWFKSQGTTLGGKTQDAKIEALWAHAVLPFWDAQLGVRQDFSGGPRREWAAFGIQGISPYWFDIELTGYVGDAGRTAARLKTEYDLYLTQRLVLKPEVELNAYGKADPPREIGAGLSDGQFELRLRYAFSRRFAPYVGVVYDRRFADSAVLARRAGDSVVDHRAVAGIDLFF